MSAAIFPWVDSVEFARTRLGFDPDARQWGKSTVAAVKAVHRAYSRGESLVLLATPSERQSGEFLRKASRMVMRLGITPRGDGDNAMSLLFPNGSRIVGLPGPGDGAGNGVFADWAGFSGGGARGAGGGGICAGIYV